MPVREKVFQRLVCSLFREISRSGAKATSVLWSSTACILLCLAVIAPASSQSTLPACPNIEVCFLSQAAKDQWAAEKGCSFPPATGVTTGLGPDADALAALSPMLQAHLEQLLIDGWTIKYGAPGKGSRHRRATKEIVIDGDSANDPNLTIRRLSHEIGHATDPDEADTSSKEAFVSDKLRAEGRATMFNITAQREIKNNGGSDIGINGSVVNHVDYNAAYDRYLQTGNIEQAERDIGQVFGQGEVSSVKADDGRSLNYRDYYGYIYDKYYGP